MALLSTWRAPDAPTRRVLSPRSSSRRASPTNSQPSQRQNESRGTERRPAARGMSAIDDLPPLREVIRRYALAARKSLGQNFLLDLNLTARIARAAGPLADATII